MSTPDIIVLYGDESKPSYLGVSSSIREKQWSPTFNICGENMFPWWGYSPSGAGPHAADLRNRLVGYNIPINSYRYKVLQGSPGDIQNQLALLRKRTGATIREYPYQESNEVSTEEKEAATADPDFIILGKENKVLCTHVRMLDLCVKNRESLSGNKLSSEVWGYPADCRYLHREELALIGRLAALGVDKKKYRYAPLSATRSTEGLIKDIQEVFKGSVTIVQFFNPPEEDTNKLEEGNSKMKNKFNIDDKVVIKQEIGFWLCDPAGREKKRSIVRKVSGVFKDKPGKRYRYCLDGVMRTTYTEEDLSSDIRGEVESHIVDAIEGVKEKAVVEIERLEAANKLLFKVLAGDIEEPIGDIRNEAW